MDIPIDLSGLTLTDVMNLPDSVLKRDLERILNTSDDEDVWDGGGVAAFTNRI